jgi:DNA-directed RNA polymerase subunit RPC12/RpoP
MLRAEEYRLRGCKGMIFFCGQCGRPIEADDRNGPYQDLENGERVDRCPECGGVLMPGTIESEAAWTA